MRLKNTSRYPDEEVRRLVAFGLAGIDHRGVAVVVKNTAGAYRGRAYPRVPARSPFSRDRRVCYLITIGIGAPDRFPRDNLVTTVRWVVVEDWTTDTSAWTFPAAGRVDLRWRGGRREHRLRRRVERRHPYGGRAAPRIELRDWREALVAVAAHEGLHIEQFRHGLPRSEVAAERHAAARLAAWRAEGAGGEEGGAP